MENPKYLSNVKVETPQRLDLAAVHKVHIYVFQSEISMMMKFEMIIKGKVLNLHVPP